MNIDKSKVGKTFWFDLPVKDVVNARSFYEGLFQWQFLLMKDSAVENYWVIQSGDELIGGIRKVDGERTASPAPVLYFTVDDMSLYVYRVKELGGALLGNTIDLGQGRGLFQQFYDREKNLLALWAPSKETL